ncbi:MAG: aminotransferase class V-fold PLP-dependent enzyme [Pseudomonadota bacterium]
MHLKSFVGEYGLFPFFEQLSTTQCWSDAKLIIEKHLAGYPSLALQSQKRNEILSLAKSLPFWQAQLKDIESFEQIPLTYKSDYVTGFPEQNVLPHRKEEHQTLASGGTSERMTVVTDFAKRDRLRALENVNIALSHQTFWARKTLDIPPSACNVTCGLIDKGPEAIWPFLRWATLTKQWIHEDTMSNLRGRIERQWLMQRTTVSPITAGDWSHICKQIDPILALLAKSRTEILRGYPLFIYWIALRAAELNTVLPALSTVIPYGGLAAENMVNTIKQSLKVNFVNLYGTGEVGSIGASPVDQHAVSIYQDDIYVELLDDNERLIVEPGILGRVVVTDLNNRVMPIIRYAIGDTAQWQNLANGRKALLVQGRVVENIVTVHGNIMTARMLQNFVLSNPNVVNFVLVQNKVNQFTLKIVKRGEVSNSSFTALHEALGGKSVQLSIIEEPFLTPKSSGKYLASEPLKNTPELHAEDVVEFVPLESTKCSLVEHFSLRDVRSPMGKKVCYLDNAATTPKPNVVVNEVARVLSKATGNVHRGAHFLGDAITEQFEQARADIARFIGATPANIVLLRNTTECLNLIAQQSCFANVITSAAEHHANFLPWKQKSVINLNDALHLDFFALEKEMQRAPHSLVTLAHISNVTGNLLDVDRVVELARKYHCKVLLDAAQSVPHMPIDVNKLSVDFLVFSGHKMGGPSGVGVLWGRTEALEQLSPVQWGGSMVEKVSSQQNILKPIPWRFEAGTPAMENVVGLAAAARFLMDIGMDNVQQHVDSLTQKLRRALKASYPALVLGDIDAPGPVSLNPTSMSAQFIANILSERDGICVRAGFHCAQPLHEQINSQGTLRISPWLMNTDEDIEKCIDAVRRVLASDAEAHKVIA